MSSMNETSNWIFVGINNCKIFITFKAGHLHDKSTGFTLNLNSRASKELSTISYAFGHERDGYMRLNQQFAPGIFNSFNLVL